MEAAPQGQSGPEFRQPASRRGITDPGRVLGAAQNVYATWKLVEERGLERVLQPATATLVGLVIPMSVLGFIKPKFQQRMCLSPPRVVEKKELGRLATCTFVHADLLHLISNVSAILQDCWQLESSVSSLQFAAELSFLMVASHSLYAGYAALFGKRLRWDSAAYHSTNMLGMSGLSFALAAVFGKRIGGRFPLPLPGLSLPTQYKWAVDLAISQLFNPSVSLIGHLSGVTAGLLYERVLKPGFGRLWRWIRRKQPVSYNRRGLQDLRRRACKELCDQGTLVLAALGIHAAMLWAAHHFSAAKSRKPMRRRRRMVHSSMTV